jgi:hypothetical protein
MTTMRQALIGSSLIAATLLLSASRAEAIPAFARKYGTSCQTCHVVYPKLTPFGEAFRRNGFKFPGRDEDYIKQESVPLGQEAYRTVFPEAVWPGTLPTSVPLALGFNGFAVAHPNKSSAGAQADNGARLSLHDLVEEAHLWGGGSFSEHISFFGELTFADGAVEIEHAELHFNDLYSGSPHLLNVYVGKGPSTLTSFGAHSSFIGDSLMPALSVTALYGATTDSFNVMGQYNLVEVNGMARGRFIYGIGANAGANLDVGTTENVYGHLGVKLGGMRLDGEGDTVGDAQKPWAETALTIDAFGYRSASRFTNIVMVDTDDLTYVLGGHARGTVGSFEIDSGVYQEWHNHATAAAGGVKALTQYDELSYIVFPWLVPAVRLEYVSLRPDGGPRINEIKILAGAAALVRPNLKLTLVGQIEHANGVPDGSWGPVGGFAAPAMGSVTELEAIQLGLAYAF